MESRREERRGLETRGEEREERRQRGKYRMIHRTG